MVHYTAGGVNLLFIENLFCFFYIEYRIYWLLEYILKLCLYKLDREKIMDSLIELVKLAEKMGASSASIITMDIISVENRLAALCKDPGCINFGQSASCPPYVAGPNGFRELIKKLSYGIFFKIDVTSEILFSNENQDIFRLLHTIASHIEHFAIKKGFLNSTAFAGGSCKQLFCNEHRECNKVKGDGMCRYPEIARPSMSGFGINVFKLIKDVGWESNKKLQKNEHESISIQSVCGLVLIG